MPSNYKSVDFFDSNDNKVTISAEPTGYGLQQKRNGEFILYREGKEPVRERWGDSYGSYTTKREAWKRVLELLKRI